MTVIKAAVPTGLTVDLAAIPATTGGLATQNALTDSSGGLVDPATSQDIQALLDSNAQEIFYLAGTATTPLASLAAGSSTTAVMITETALYSWTAAFGGASTLQLQFLLADGVTPADVAGGALAASGYAEAKLFAGPDGVPVLLKNTGANPITNLTSALVS